MGMASIVASHEVINVINEGAKDGGHEENATLGVDNTLEQ